MPRSTLETRFFRQVMDALTQDQMVLPTLPEVAVRIAQITRDPEVSIGKLVVEIAKDPATSVRLLRVANSAAQGGPQRAQSLQQAVTRLGLQLTRLLVTGLALEQMFFSDSPSLKERLRVCWNDSVEVGALSRVLAARCTRLQPELVMLAGLVHRVGVLPILKLAEKNFEILAQPQAVDEVIAQLAPRVGRLVLQAWNFPQEMIEVPMLARDFTRQHAGPPDCIDVVSVAVLQCCSSREPALAAIDRSTVPALAQLRLDPKRDILEQLDATAAIEEQRSLLAA